MAIPTIWISAAALYVLFYLWYTNRQGPLTDEEVKTFSARLDAREDISDAERNSLKEFMRTDDGREFMMLNVIKFNGGKIAHPDTGKEMTALRLLRGYTRPFVGALMRRAGHPIFFSPSLGGYIDSWNTPDDPGWSAMGYMRYRSRRDLFELATAPEFGDGHRFKSLAVDQTFNFPTRPRIAFVLGPRAAVPLILVLIAAFSTIAVMAAG